MNWNLCKLGFQISPNQFNWIEFWRVSGKTEIRNPIVCIFSNDSFSMFSFVCLFMRSNCNHNFSLTHHMVVLIVNYHRIPTAQTRQNLINHECFKMGTVRIMPDDGEIDRQIVFKHRNT